MLKLKRNARLSLSKFPRIAHRGMFVVSTIVLVGTSLTYGLVQKVAADQYDNQINALRQQNASAQSAVNSLQAQALTYQDSINQLQSQINSLQSSIEANVAEQNALRQQIVDAQNQINQERAYLSTNIKAMYVDGTPTTLEVLATSKNLSDFVDKQEYRTRVQSKLQDTLQKIADLQAQLKVKEASVEQLLNDQRTQQAQLDSDRAQQQQLLNYNESQQSAYTAQLQANNAQIAKLQAQQLAAYQKLTSGGTRSYGSYGTFEFRNLTAEYTCGGGYSYCWAGFDQPVSDTWGLGLARECVHYAADRAARGLDLSPYLGKYWGAGNAENWPQNLGGVYTVDHNPTGGHVVAVVAWPGGGGHAMYVESVLGDGWVHVSQMNWDVRGHYSEMDVKSSGVLFVHFP